MRLRLMSAAGVWFVCVSTPAVAQQLPEWITRTHLSGLAFGDFYAMAANHDPTLEGANGFWARRVYLTVDSRFSEAFATRLRLEMNSPGDFTTPGKLEPFVKDLWVQWAGGRQQVFLGISGTPTWDLVESVWGYRNVEKTPLDLQKLGGSRDFGLAARGRLDRAGRVRYHAMVGNGADTKAETNEEKKAYLAVAVHPVEHLVLEVYADFEDCPGDNDRVTVQGFVAYDAPRARVGVQAARQHRELGGGETLDLDLVSTFVVLNATSRVALLARFDRMLDPNPDGPSIAYLPLDAEAKSNLLLAAIDFTLHEHVHLIPNVEAVLYDSNGPVAPDSDVMLRTTFSVTF